MTAGETINAIRGLLDQLEAEVAAPAPAPEPDPVPVPTPEPVPEPPPEPAPIPAPPPASPAPQPVPPPTTEAGPVAMPIEPPNVASAAEFYAALKSGVAKIVVKEGVNLGQVNLVASDKPNTNMVIVRPERRNAAAMSRLVMRDVQGLTIEGFRTDLPPGGQSSLIWWDIRRCADVNIMNNTLSGDARYNFASVGSLHSYNAIDRANAALYGIGIYMADCRNSAIARNEITAVFKGILVTKSLDMAVTGNDVNNCRSDFINFAAVTNYVQRGNMMRWIRGATNGVDGFNGDHHDAIGAFDNPGPSANVLMENDTYNQMGGVAAHGCLLVNPARNGYDNVTMRNCNFHMGHAIGIVFNGVRSGKIENCTVHAVTPDMTYPGNLFPDGDTAAGIAMPKIRAGSGVQIINSNVISG